MVTNGPSRIWEEIARAGGGIVSTVKATRHASDDALLEDALTHVNALIAEGVSLIEVKSGYGLEPETKTRMLRAAWGGATQAEIRLTNGNDYVPFADDKLDNGGLATDIVTEAAKLLGEDINYTWLPWDEGFERAKTGEFDGTLPYFYNAERNKVFFYSESIYDVVQRLFLKSDVRVIPSSVDDISGMTICNLVGYAPPGVIKNAFDAGTATQQSPPDMTRCFELLALGRVNAVLANSLQVWDQVDKNADLDEFSVEEAPRNIQINTQSVILPHAKGVEACLLMAR